MISSTWNLRLFGWWKIPLIGLLRPRVIACDLSKTEVSIPLGYWSKNHLNSLYFGALCVGADIAGGLFAMDQIRSEKLPINLIFKDFRAEFLKRADSDTHFICSENHLIKAALQQAMETGERVNQTVEMLALCPKTAGQDPVARFHITVSLKRSPKQDR